MEAWMQHAADLAAWTMARLANRTDAYGSYSGGGGTTRKKTLTAALLTKHYEGRTTIGLHTTSVENTCRWLALDFDCHDGDEAVASANDRAVKALQLHVRDMFDLNPLVFDTNGRGGYHVVFVFADPLPTLPVCRFGKYLRHELELSCEVFPKQEELPPGGFGNWLRLPGRHHRYTDHWHRAWSGAGWLEGANLCQFLVSVEGDNGEAVLDEAHHYGSAPARLGVPSDGRPANIELSAFTLKYRLEGASQGERNQTLFEAACDYAGCGFTSDRAIEDLLPVAIRTGLTETEARTAITSAYTTPREPRGMQTAIERYNRLGPGQHGGPPDVPEAGTEPARPRPTLANFIRVTNTEGEVNRLVRPVEAIAADVHQFSAGWPRRAHDVAFALGRYERSQAPPADAVRYLRRPEDLFAWVNLVADVSWARQGVRGQDNLARTPVTKAELTAHVCDTCEPNYAGIEFLPHVPPVGNLFYVPFDLPEPTGEALTTLMDHCNPETEEDRALMLASLVTPGWGGPPGTRPAFVFCSDHGRGVGKTATVTAFTEVWGGAVSLAGTSKQDWMQVKARLLDDSALAQRCVVIDNVKGKFSAGELESMLTAPRIDGKRMYVGQYSRPNRLTFYLTANVPRMSRDLAERSIIIKVGPTRWGENFVEWAQRFIRDNRLALLADIFAWLQQPPKCDLVKANKLTRWTSWAHTVLARFDNGPDLLQLVSDRREPVDTDAEEADEIRVCIRDGIRARGMLPDTGVTLIERPVMAQLLTDAKLLEGRWSLRRVHGYLMSLCGSGMLKELTDVSDGQRRLWQWAGPDAPPGTRRVVLPTSGLFDHQPPPPGSADDLNRAIGPPPDSGQDTPF